jgi:general nucleoside transport system permease protein
MTLVRRWAFSLLAPVLAVVVAVVISSLVMAALQVNPLRVFEVMVDFGETPAQQVTAMVVILNRAVPLFLAGLAVAVAFRMGLFNIGVEGQYRLATIMAAAAGAAVSLPAPLHVVLIVVVAMLVGAFWAGIVAVLKVTRGVSEVLSSIMLNFVALGLASFFLTGPFQGPQPAGTQIVTTREIPESGWVPSLNGLLGALGLENPPRQLYGFLVIAAVVGVFVAVLLNRTRFGFDLRASGLSPSAASASGVNARGMVIKTMLLSGMIAGLIGLPDLLGQTHAYTTNFTAGLGFLGIAVSLLGRNRPGGIALAALLFAFLDRALVPLQIADYPASVVTIFQGTIVLAVVIANEVSRRVARRTAESNSAQPVPVVSDGTGSGDVPPSGTAGSTDVRQGVQA